jgi:hypothetical protein
VIFDFFGVTDNMELFIVTNSQGLLVPQTTWPVAGKGGFKIRRTSSGSKSAVLLVVLHLSRGAGVMDYHLEGGIRKRTVL